MFVDTLLVFDHVTHRIKVCSHVRLDGDIEKAYEEATAPHRRPGGEAAPAAAAAPRRGGSTACSRTPSSSSNFTKERFEAAVSQIKEYITAGEAIQVVLSQRFAKPTSVAPLDIYRALRTINPSPYMFYLRLGGLPHHRRLAGDPGPGGGRRR